MWLQSIIVPIDSFLDKHTVQIIYILATAFMFLFEDVLSDHFLIKLLKKSKAWKRFFLILAYCVLLLPALVFVFAQLIQLILFALKPSVGNILVYFISFFILALAINLKYYLVWRKL